MFIIFCLLLTLYPLRQVVLPSYYGKVIAGLNKGESASFVQNVKRLVLIFIVVQVLSAIIHKVQGMMVPKFLDYSVKITGTVKSVFHDIIILAKKQLVTFILLRRKGRRRMFFMFGL